VPSSVVVVPPSIPAETVKPVAVTAPAEPSALRGAAGTHAAAAHPYPARRTSSPASARPRTERSPLQPRRQGQACSRHLPLRPRAARNPQLFASPLSHLDACPRTLPTRIRGGSFASTWPGAGLHRPTSTKREILVEKDERQVNNLDGFLHVERPPQVRTAWRRPTSSLFLGIQPHQVVEGVAVSARLT
jgi:hypothetical protein